MYLDVMSLFKSNNDEIPEIPPAPSIQKFPNLNIKDSTIPELPTLPSKNSMNEKFNEQMVKSAIDDNYDENEYDYSNQDDNFEDINQIKNKLQNIERMVKEHPREYDYPTEDQNQPIPDKNTIFVKIDKFKSLQKTLVEMQEKIKELSKQVQNLRQVKTKELEEIDAWDTQMRKMNQKLSKIDSDMFQEV